MIVHVPIPTKETTAPETVHTEAFNDPKVTEFPEAPPVAVKEYVGPPGFADPGAVDVMVTICVAWVTVMDIAEDVTSA